MTARQSGSTARALFAAGIALSLAAAAQFGYAQTSTGDGEPARDRIEIDIDGANFEPLPIAIQPFEAQPGLEGVSSEIEVVIRDNLERSGLFEIVPQAAFIAQPTEFDIVPNYRDWRAINVDALVAGRVQRAADGRLQVQFRAYDVLAGEQLTGLQYLAAPSDARRVAHQVSDGIYSQLTGDGAYFDSRLVFVDETGPKDNRTKRLAIMDQDGANLRYLADAEGLVLTPRFSPTDQALLYISYDSGQPEVFLLNLDTGQRERLGNFPGMTFAPRFSPDGRSVVLSLAENGNTDLYQLSLATRQLTRLTDHPAIDTGASYSPDGGQIVFESDRGGAQQLYVMPATGGPARRISFGRGNYGTPVWSPRGDRIAFTKILDGKFHIGIMRIDGTEERLLTQSFLDEGPTFSPNGRVLMFFREFPGEAGRAQLMSIDITGRNLRVVQTPNAGSDPAWSPLRR